MAETRPASQKDGGFTMKERKRLRQEPAPGLRRGLMVRPGARRAWEDGEGCGMKSESPVRQENQGATKQVQSPQAGRKGSGYSLCTAG